MVSINTPLKIFFAINLLRLRTVIKFCLGLKVDSRSYMLVKHTMEMPVCSTKFDKINLVSTFLMSGPEYGWLFLVGGSGGGEGKTMATNEAITLWRNSMGEDVYQTCYDDTAAHKVVLMKKGTPIVKTIIQTNAWGPEWEFMAKEWDAKVVIFQRGNELS